MLGVSDLGGVTSTVLGVVRRAWRISAGGWLDEVADGLVEGGWVFEGDYVGGF